MNTNNPCHQFDRSNPIYPLDSTHLGKPSHKYLGKITNSEVHTSQSHTPKSIRTIDDAIVVESVDEKTRAAAVDYFKTSKLQASLHGQMHKTEFYKSIVVTILGLGLGIGCAPLMPATLPIIGGITGFALSILGATRAIAKHSEINASDNEIDDIERMANQWKDPADKVSAQRKKAGIQGFQYAYKSNLKGSVIHNQEVRELWLNDFSKLIGGRQSLHQMCNENLLGEGCVAYSWNSSRLPDIEISGRHFSASTLNTLSQQFGACRTSYNSFQMEVDKEVKILDNLKSKLKSEVNEMRSRWLYPSECFYMQSKQEAAHLHENALKPYADEKSLAIAKAKQSYHYTPNTPLDENEQARKNTLERQCLEEIQHITHQYNNHPAVISIHNAYKRDSRMCDLLYNQSQLVVNSYFDDRIRQIGHAYNTCKGQVEELRSAGLHSLKETMDKILANAENPLSYINTSSPNVYRNWRMPPLSYEPSWNEVYGQQPHFQSNFRDEVPETAWNNFWGNQGFGHFASFPTSSWSSFSKERGTFPFQQQWFNLRNLQQDSQNSFANAPRAGMFMREVRVPTSPAGTSARPNVNPVKTPVTSAQERVIPGSRTATGFATTENR